MMAHPQAKPVAKPAAKLADDWRPDSWRSKPIEQVPEYVDASALARVRAELAKYPPLIFAGEARQLKRDLAEVARGKAFLFHGGDCAESFDDFSTTNIRDTFRVLLQIAVVLLYAGRKPITKIGRMAGQFAKPRSNPMEEQNGLTLPSYKGDIINGVNFDLVSRTPDPQRLIRGYFQSASTLNLLRAFSSGGYAALSKAHNWLLGFVENSSAGAHYEELAQDITRSVEFMQACGITEDTVPSVMRQTNFYTSHEALLLEYEEPLTRVDSTTGIPYATSAHFLWIGDRTRHPDGAHVEYMRGIDNPIGIKCGPSLTPEALLRLLERLNPHNEEGRITLINRLGAGQVEKFLPAFIKNVTREGFNVVWCCDPMHGNTEKSSSGYKTRRVPNILQEIQEFFHVCAAEGVYAGGVHLEMTGKNVTECVGGAEKIGDQDLATAYDTLCDPRLNASQAIELAFEIAKLLRPST